MSSTFARLATPGRILLVGWLLFLVYAYPGYLSNDPVLQLAEARGGNIGDWHPPAMAILWRYVEYVIPGTFGMLVVQSVPLLLGLNAILRRLLSERKAACTAVAIFLFPPVMTTMAVIWKDSQMAGYLTAGIACLLSSQLRWRLVGCGLLWLGTLMRYNALAATFPLVLLLFEWRPGIARLKRYAIAFGMWIAITASATATNAALAEREEHMWYLGAMHDIAGIMHYTPPRTDAEIEKLMLNVLHVHENVAAEIDKRYVSWTGYYLAVTDSRVFDFPITDEERERVRRTWFKLIKHEPVAYLRHRLAVSLEILGITDHPWQPVWDGFGKDADTQRFVALSISMHHSSWQGWWVHSLQAIGDTALFRPYVYFGLAILLLWFARRSRLDLALLLSALCYEGTMFVAAVADARYSHWMETCVVLVYVRLVVTRSRRLV